MTALRLLNRTMGVARPLVAAQIPLQRRCAIRLSSTGPATIVDTGFWRSLIPKPFRKENRRGKKGIKGKNSKEWNPATFFIVMFLFIGSMSIQMIALRNQSERYNRQSTVRIGQLREALRKLQNGEQVDVDRLLGNPDDSQKETDWEEMLKALESDEASQMSRDEVAKSKQSETQTKKAAATKPQITDNMNDEVVGDESPATEPKPANLGNFF
ncbi:hypothetical protein QQS21_011147 [Conoideocrella luteorostrata]|uniref:Uncharacterized protein n=1 Tax=Conoideocrella luteorostrata TaxID=1105319 RepID=A0AAJ0CI68_9HYPO|nr:hypothetical protein QQS21_011147 [Conoideocrella luteorostrata]